jgi:hypothetical protein
MRVPQSFLFPASSFSHERNPFAEHLFPAGFFSRDHSPRGGHLNDAGQDVLKIITVCLFPSLGSVRSCGSVELCAFVGCTLSDYSGSDGSSRARAWESSVPGRPFTWAQLPSRSTWHDSWSGFVCCPVSFVCLSLHFALASISPSLISSPYVHLPYMLDLSQPFISPNVAHTSGIRYDSCEI